MDANVTSHLVVQLDVLGAFTVAEQKSKAFYRAVAKETRKGKNLNKNVFF